MNCLYCNLPCSFQEVNNPGGDIFVCEHLCFGTPRFSNWNCRRPRYPWQVDFVVELNNMVFHVFFYPAKQEAAVYISDTDATHPTNYVQLAHPCLTPDNLREFINRIIKLKVFI